MKTLLVAIAMLMNMAGQAFAWDDEGHRVAAEIAEHYLEPATARQVRELLAIENATTLADVSTWADQIRPQRAYTAPWHFVGIPVHPPSGTPMAYDAARDCPRGDCVVAAIERFAGVLRDKSAPPRDRLEALKFVVHFVADVHQPLHCADDNDSNGNDTRVIFLGQHMTLHAVWDGGILAAVQIGNERTYALKLTQSISAENLAQWRGGSSADWATESYRIGRLIYGGSHEARALQIFYETDFLPVVNTQLEKAGVR